MPIYEYKCPQCNNVFEEWVKSHAQTAACPNCQAEAVQIISNTSFVLKGGGWYVTEYGNRKNDAQEKNEQAPEQKTSDAKDSTKDSKADATSTTAKQDTPKTTQASNSKQASVKPKQDSKGTVKAAS